MTMKPFEIQSTSLSIGGVTIDTSAQGKLVIPGVTRASTNIAIEVEDTGDQTVSWTGTPVVIDGYTYAVYMSNDAQGLAGWSHATYAIDQLDEEGFIDGINVVDGGANYTGEVITFCQVMYAAPEGTPIDNSNNGAWVQIPFRVRCGAGEIESEFGGSGGASALEQLNDVDVSDPQNGEALVWDSNDEVWKNQTVSGTGNANTGNITFDGSTVIGSNYTLNLAPDSTSEAAGKYLRVRGGDQDSHIHFDTNDNSTYDLYLGDDGKYVRVSKDGEVVIGVDGAWEGNPSSGKRWTFNTDGTLHTPGYTLPATDGTAGQVLSTDGNGVVTWADSGTAPAVTSYKGFKAHYGRMYGSEPTLSKLVIYKDSVSPTSSIDTSTNNDTFEVSNLTGSDIVVYFLLAGTDTSNPESLETLKAFVEAAIDNVILVDGVEGDYRNAADMKAAFYMSYSTLAATAGTLYNNFQFLSTVYLNINGNASSLIQGSGSNITLSDDGAGNYSVLSINNGGSNYRAGHKLLIAGSLLGGSDGTNDAIITVSTADENGVITSATVAGAAFATAPVGGWTIGSENITNYNVGSGFVPYGLQYNPNDNTMGLNGWQNGNNYVVGDRIVILGNDIQNSNTGEYWTSPTNDVTILVTEVYGGNINNFVISGEFPAMSGWPSNNINDGGDDQYDGGNYISTDLETNISYNDGNVVTESYIVGGGDYVAVYQSSIFGFFVSGANFNLFKTDGDSGFDGSGTGDTGSLYDAGTTDTPTVITWTNPNNNIWRIEEYNGGAGVYYDGGDYDAKWFDVSNHTSGNNNFRGAIIQYHAYVQGQGNIIGTIHLADDYTQEAATHTEHLSGNSNLQYATLWQCNNERGQLFFKMTNGNSRSLMVQWTAKIFYGSEANC